ncbi:NlpC/P60 family protein [Lactococcus lactis]
MLAQTGEAEDWSDKARGDLLITADDASEDEQHAAIYLGGGFILHGSKSCPQVIVPKTFLLMT